MTLSWAVALLVNLLPTSMANRSGTLFGTFSLEQAHPSCPFANDTISTMQRHHGPSRPVRLRHVSNFKSPMVQPRVAESINLRNHPMKWYAQLGIRWRSGSERPTLPTSLFAATVLRLSMQRSSVYCSHRACEDVMSSRLLSNTIAFCDRCKWRPARAVSLGLQFHATR